jgi:hypothetical protein
MRTWSVLGLIVVGSSLWVIGDGTLAVAGFSEQRACEDKLFSQGVRRREAESRCEVCFLKPGSSACREQFRGGSSEGSSSGSCSMGRGGGGSYSGSSDGTDTSHLRKLGRDSETGASYECVNQVGESRGTYANTLTIEYKNICGHTVIIEDVCGSKGMRPMLGGSDKVTISANSSSKAVCE